MGHFIDLAFFVIGDPFAGLGAVVEVAGAHEVTVLAEPFPIADEDAVGFFAAGPKGAVFVINGVFFGD